MASFPWRPSCPAQTGVQLAQSPALLVVQPLIRGELGENADECPGVKNSRLLVVKAQFVFRFLQVSHLVFRYPQVSKDRLQGIPVRVQICAR